MNKTHKANGILKYIKISDDIDDEVPLSSALEENYELIKLSGESEQKIKSKLTKMIRME
ncbi:hypothetical protein [Pseudoalteromonas ostreae]|uniref:hypothetical protein n=1 Tax=Pseudoalteromonas ostreae TaxID=2774154 RepID=UPI001B3642FE|nr:hypothetical protein [Pseudoalteromonas ostreae]